MIREPSEQVELGVPRLALEGHGWHNYIITSETPNEGIDQLYEELRRFIEFDPVFSSSGYFVHEGSPNNREIITNLTVLEGKTGKDLDVSEEVHTLSLDGTVGFSLYYKPGKTLIISHNVNGRVVYAKGTLRALKFLEKKMKAGEKGQAYSMIDVLNNEI